MDRIGVRDLRQHASRYLARVRDGETIEITDRGRPVARLVPLTGDPWRDLVASGRVTTAETGVDLLAGPTTPHAVDTSAALDALRDGER